jgi:hypothetical protein
MDNFPDRIRNVIFASRKSVFGLGVAMLILTAGLALEAVRQHSVLTTRIHGTEITRQISDTHGQPVAALKISLNELVRRRFRQRRIR